MQLKAPFRIKKIFLMRHYSLFGILLFILGFISFHIEASTSHVNARIIGGTSASTAYPWMVSVRYKGNASSHFCGGTLTSSKWVLTAAHCFVNDDPDSEYEVLIGTLDRTTVSTSSNVVQVKSVITHPQYDAHIHKNDFALLELATAFEPTSSLTLADSSIVSSALAGTVTAIGWGVEHESDR